VLLCMDRILLFYAVIARRGGGERVVVTPGDFFIHGFFESDKKELFQSILKCDGTFYRSTKFNECSLP
jgi:hypothetical protein